MKEKVRILIVDDEAVNLENIRYYLTKKGYAPQVAENGFAAIDLLDKYPFDLIVTDLKMEGFDGWQVLEYCQRKRPEVKVIIMTGYATASSANDALARGAYFYLPKPIKLTELNGLIEKAIQTE